jgi:ribose transport system permease protein
MNKRSPLKTLLDINGIGIIVVYVVVFATLSLLSPHFLSFSNVMIGLRQAVFTAIVAFAMIFVITMGGIDLSVGSIVGISGMLAAVFLLDGMNVYLSVGLVLCIGAGIGLFNGLVITIFNIPYFIATLGSMSILRGLIYVYTKGIPLYGLRFPEFRFIGQGYVGVVPTPIIIALALLAVSYYLFYKTRFGRYTVSIGSNEDASRLVGVAVGRIKVLVFMLSGVFCALAGVILASRSEAAIPEAGSAYEMDAIAATVIGGTSMSGGKGNMIGTAFGAVLMATIRNGLSLLNVNTFWHQVVIGIFILFAVAFDRFAAKRAE